MSGYEGSARAALVEAISECLGECLQSTSHRGLNEVPLADGSIAFIDGISEAIADVVGRDCVTTRRR